MENVSIQAIPWSQQKIDQIDSLTKAGGFANYMSAIGQAALLQGTSVADSSYFTLQAVIAIPSLELKPAIGNVKLALKHAAQACLTFPAFIIPRIAVATSDWLQIRSVKTPIGRLEQAKKLAASINLNAVRVGAEVVGLFVIAYTAYRLWTHVPGKPLQNSECPVSTHVTCKPLLQVGPFETNKTGEIAIYISAVITVGWLFQIYYNNFIR